MKSSSSRKKRGKRKSIKGDDMPDWLRLRNCRPIRLESKKNTTEDSYSIGSQTSRKVPLRRKLSAEFYPNSISNISKITPIRS